MDLVVLLITVVSLAVGAFAMYGGARKLRLWRLIARTPTSPAGALGAGPVEVCGAVEPEGPLATAPFSGRPVVYGRWSVEERRRSGKSSKWVTVDQGVVGGLFRVKDATGSVRVHPDGAEEDLEETWSAQSGLGRDPPASVARFLETRGRASETFLGFNKTMRFRERMLVPGEEVYVLGTAGPDAQARLAIGAGDAGFPFFVSSRSERGALRRTRNVGIGTLLLGALFVGVGAFLAATRLVG